ncbi:glycosyl transferase family 1 [Rhodococcoides trifolii]|uniref:Glycosyl transferase family 1 n=1 Tax=Rhodococcoides trifolii TaxID=908250 RepID=A0A917LGA1_9NOCA|nr:glycosyltransferase family 4 protein [Rhodococcus trifolii]GGG20146.1 glycosyl transferase family 1 [Rhodococcus trifolii]
MNSLRIALLASSRFPVRQPFAGGLEAHVWQLARSLSGRGHEVSLFAADGSSVDAPYSRIPVRRFDMTDIAAADPTTPRWAVEEHHAYLAVMMDMAGELRDSFDVIHNHSLHYLPIAMSPMVSTPMLTTLHTPPFAWLESAVALQQGAFTQFAAVSAFTARQWHPVTGDVPVVPNGIPLDSWPVGDGAGEYAVWSGRLVPEKGVTQAIEAARAAGYRLKLAGPTSNIDYFRSEVQPLLGADVTYEGHLRRDDLAALVGGASVAVVSPLWEEPYGLVVAEALSCGTPVAAYSRGGIPEIIDATSGRLAPPDDIGGLADAIFEAAQLSRSDVRARAEQACSEETMVDRYLTMYRSMLRPSRSITSAGSTPDTSGRSAGSTPDTLLAV